MSILGDVFKELFKMFVADLRLTLKILCGLISVALLLHLAIVGPVAAGVLLTLIPLLVLGEAVFRESRRKRG